MKEISNISPLKLVELINRVELFKGLEVQEREALAFTPSIIVTIEPGETFIKQGQFDPNLFIILSGTATVVMDRIKITDVGAGAFLGEFGFLFEEQRNASVIADTNLVAIRLTRKSFDRLQVVVRDKIKDRLMKGLIERVQQQNATIAELQEKQKES